MKTPQVSSFRQSCPSRRRTDHSVTLEGARYTVLEKGLPDFLAAQEYNECLTICSFYIFTLLVHKSTRAVAALFDDELLCIYLQLLM